MKYDAIVVGGGIIGMATAYHVLRTNPGKKILVIEKFGAPGQGNTAKSAGAYRNVFSSNTNFMLADTSVNYFLDISDKGADIGLEKAGYLWLFTKEQFEKRKPLFDEMMKNGVELRFLKPDELNQILPDICLKPDDEEAQMMGLGEIHVGVFGKKCGFIDADRLTRFYEQEYKALGGEVKYNTEVKKLIVEPKEPIGVPWEPFIWQDVGVIGVSTAAGEIRADKIFVATNAWAPQLLDGIGIDSMVKSAKHQMFVLRSDKMDRFMHPKGLGEKEILPFTILPKSVVYIRPDIHEGSFWVSAHDNLGHGLKFEEDPKAENEFYEYNIYQILRKYIPVVDGVSPSNKWAGLYDVNSIDANPYIFEKGNVISVVGLSGSGIMKADAVGRIAAAMYNGQEYAELYGGKKFKVSDLGISNRKVEKELFVL